MNDLERAEEFVRRHKANLTFRTLTEQQFTAAVSRLSEEARMDEREAMRSDRESMIRAAQGMAIRSRISVQQALLAMEEATRIVADHRSHSDPA